MTTNACLNPAKLEFLIPSTVRRRIPAAHRESLLIGVAALASLAGVPAPAKKLRARAAKQQVETRCAVALNNWVQARIEETLPVCIHCGKVKKRQAGWEEVVEI